MHGRLAAGEARQHPAGGKSNTKGGNRMFANQSLGLTEYVTPLVYQLVDFGRSGSTCLACGLAACIDSLCQLLFGFVQLLNGFFNDGVFFSVFGSFCFGRHDVFSRWVTLLRLPAWHEVQANADRKSTRLNSSHVRISYAVFC